jgi:tripartite-type tricarboxylate transporter receptor subunit TctC
VHPYAWTRCTRPGTGFRLDSLSQVPTVIEQGVKDYEAVVWFGLATPAGTPQDVVNKIAEDLRASLAESDVRSKLIGGGMFPAFLGPQASGTHIQQEYNRYSRVIDEARIKLD